MVKFKVIFKVMFKVKVKVNVLVKVKVKVLFLSTNGFSACASPKPSWSGAKSWSGQVH